jgi:hypothetical protein
MFRHSLLIVGLLMLPGCAFIDRTATILGSIFNPEASRVLPEAPETVSYQIPALPALANQAVPEQAASEIVASTETRAAVPRSRTPRPQNVVSAAARSNNARLITRAEFITVPTISARSMPVTSTSWDAMPEFSSARNH